MRSIGAHIKVFLIATVFGLGAYGVIQVLLHFSRAAGLLDWLR
jgi:hypothetical protein